MNTRQAHHNDERNPLTLKEVTNRLLWLGEQLIWTLNLPGIPTHANIKWITWAQERIKLLSKYAQSFK